ncbi:MAG: beta strand repeat-containing protein, partial [Spongiibacteraceae bacterium]
IQSQESDLTGISVSDVDAGLADITVTLNADNGVLNTLGDAVTITGLKTNNLILEGDIAGVNDALSTLTYTANSGFVGSDNLLVVSDDGGATGSGGAMSDSDSITINVNPLQPAAILGEDTADISGFSVSNIGDVNGDGSDDLLIGSPGGNNNHGLAYVVYGRADLPDSLPLTNLPPAGGTEGFVITGSGIEALAGFSVSGAGDVNGDGFADVLVGAPGFDGALPAPSNSYLIYGGQGLDADIDVSTFTQPSGDNGVVLEGVNVADGTGHSVSIVGDVNGDGYADMLIAAPDDNSNTGAAYLVFGSASLSNQFSLQSLPTGDGSQGFQITGLTVDSFLGFSVSAAGDVNGDGLDDMIFAAPGANDAYVLFGSDQDFPGILGTFNVASIDGMNGFVLQGAGSIDLNEASVAGAGDFNGDGLNDLIVGAPQENSAAGASFVVYGSLTPSAAVPLDTLAGGDGSMGFVINGVAAGDHSGHSVASAGDFNGDGIDDILVGAHSSVNGQAYLIFGGQSTGGQFDLSALASGDGSMGFVIDAIPETNIQGRSVSSAGDINGDGFDDLLLGAPGESGDVGATAILYGASAFTGNPILGNNSADVLTGTAADEQLVGGVGNDILDGVLGSDVLIGGNGDDILIYDSADDLRVDGGNGRDKLELKSGDSLDLRLISDALLSGIEVIDAETDTASNALAMELADVLSMSDTTNDLFIIGGANDTVSLNPNFVLALVGEQIVGDSRFYDVYRVTDTDALLYIDDDVTVTGANFNP